jgi:peptidoglycan-associated lipoprotein
MKSLKLKKQLVTVVVLTILGLGGCSSSNMKSATSSANENISQTSQADASIASKPAEDDLPPLSLLTYFDFDSARLSAETTVALDSAVDLLVRSPSALVVISGHADERGTREYNLALGHLRASAVADYMVAKGVDGSRIKKVSYGKEKPLLKGSNEEVWSKNRRVEINGD